MKWQAQATALQSFQEIKESDPGIVGTKSKSYLFVLTSVGPFKYCIS